VSSTDTPLSFAWNDPVAREERVLSAARSYGEEQFPDSELDVREFGIPSVGLDESETHFVAIESQGTRLLVRVTIYPDASVRVDPLSAS
jgi:hypothetical protein